MQPTHQHKNTRQVEYNIINNTIR